MAFEISESLVSLAYQSLGYFVIEGREVGHNEIDLLALRLGPDGSIAICLHVEVQIGINPIGVLGGRRKGLAQSNSDPDGGAREWIAKKFTNPKVAGAVRQAFCGRDYRRVFVHGLMKDDAQLNTIAQCGVECRAIGDLVRDALTNGAPNRLKRAFGIAKLIAGSQ